jgi:hypothetical protein
VDENKPNATHEQGIVSFLVRPCKLFFEVLIGIVMIHNSHTSGYYNIGATHGVDDIALNGSREQGTVLFLVRPCKFFVEVLTGAIMLHCTHTLVYYNIGAAHVVDENTPNSTHVQGIFPSYSGTV